MSKEGTFVIGRDASADIVIDDETVGRRHAEIVVTDEKFFLADLGSSNGTHQLLDDGQEVRFTSGWVSASDRFAFGRVESNVGALLATLPESRLQALGIQAQVSVAAASTAGVLQITAGSSAPEEEAGRRVRCMSCGEIFLAVDAVCPKCSTPRSR